MQATAALTVAGSDRVEALLRQIAGDDLNREAVYLLNREAARMEQAGFLGCYYEALDLVLRNTLAHAHEWRGRGFCAVIDVAAIRQHHEAAALDRLLAAVCVHELAHHLEAWGRLSATPRPIASEPPPNLPTVVALVAQWRDQNEARQKESAPAWTGHGARFHRALAHLCHRLKREGHWGIATATLGFAGYGLSGMAKYERTLAGELLSGEGSAIRPILDSHPPPAFEALWERDTGQPCFWWY